VSRELLFAAFFFAVFMFLLYELFQFLAASAGPLLWAAILALTFYPFTTRLTRAFRGARGLAASVLVLLVTAGAILPMVWLGSMLVREAAQAYEQAQSMVATGQLDQLLETLRTSWAGRLWERVSAPFAGRVDIDPAALAISATRAMSQALAGQTAALARNALLTLVNFMLMLVALFFFFRDGERMAAAIRDLVPMSDEHKGAIFRRLYDTLTAVVQSMLLNAFAQGTLGGIGYWLIGGLQLSVLLGFLTALSSLIPVTGAMAVWGSCAIYLAAIGETGRAIGLTLWGVLVVSMVDNVIRPLFIGGRARLPTFLLLFSILGGLQLYGFVGIFVAPVMVALVLSFVQIYRELYPLGPSATVQEPE
jgi:predicted PurR-regulated permease PerM